MQIRSRLGDTVQETVPIVYDLYRLSEEVINRLVEEGT